MNNDKFWKEDLSKFKIPQARLLYMIFFLFKANEINYQQKIWLKQRVMLEDEKINSVYLNFERTMDIDKLLSDFNALYDSEKKLNEDSTQEMEIPKTNVNKNGIDIKGLKIQTGKDVIKSKAKQNTVIIEELSSPYGNDLLEAKRRRENKKGGKKEEETNAAFDVVVCDEGLQSPNIIPNNYKKKKDEKEIKSFLGHAVSKI